MGIRLVALCASPTVLLIVACSAPPTRAAATPAPVSPGPAPIAAVSAPPASQRSASAAPVATASAPPLIEPAPLPNPGCSFETAAGSLVGTLALQLDGHSIGEIDGAVQSLRVQVSRDAKLATVQVVTWNLELKADLNPHLIELAHAASAAPVDQWIELRSAKLSRCADGKATVRFTLPSSVTPSTAVSSAEVELGQVSLLRSEGHSGGTMEFLKTSARSALRVAPNGKIVAEVFGPPPSRPGEPTLASTVTVLDRKGSLARVVIEGDEADAIGWINGSALEPAAGVFGMLGALGHAGLSDQRLQCPQGAKLLARAGNAVWQVGSIRPGGEVQVLPGRDGSFVVELAARSYFAGLGLTGTGRPSVVPGEVLLPKEEAQRCVVKAPTTPKKR